MLLQICELLPRELQGLLACCSPVPPLLRQNLTAVHKMVLSARATQLNTVRWRRTPEAQLRIQGSGVIDSRDFGGIKLFALLYGDIAIRLLWPLFSTYNTALSWFLYIATQ